MQRFRKVVVASMFLLTTAVNGSELIHFSSSSKPGDSTRVSRFNDEPNGSILKQEVDFLNQLNTEFNTKRMFSSSLLSSRPALLEFDLRQKSQMRFQISQEKDLLFINRWRFEFRKYVHGPKFAILTISISI